MRAELNYLTVPIELDALLIDGPAMAAVRRAPDYSRLPYYDASVGDVNADLAYVAEAILPQPFANANLQLEHGLHLHWAMPDALGHGHLDSDSGDVTFPSLPNRWLVTRQPTDNTDEDNADHTMQWIVESDYVTPVGVNKRASAISVPLVAEGQEGRTQPFRYLGRSMRLEAWPGETNLDDAYLTNDEFDEPLTVFGFGDPTFAGYYPSCHSVFGFVDTDPPDDLTSVRYDVLGWYSERRGVTTDPLQACLDNRTDLSAKAALEVCLEEFGWQVTLPSANKEVEKGKADLEALLEEHGSKVPVPDTEEEDTGASDLPSRVLCVASMTFAPDGGKATPVDDRVRVTIANSPGEAIAAHAARTVVEKQGPGGPTNETRRSGLRTKIEQALEHVQFQGLVDEDSLNLLTLVRATQHETRFSPVGGGSLWRVRTDSNQAAQSPSPSAAQAIAEQASRTPLSQTVLDALSNVNELQRTYDAGRATIDGLQRRLFADWYKYMFTLYPPDGDPNSYPDPDEIRLFIERADLPELQDLLRVIGELVIDQDITAARAFGDASVATQLLDALKELAAQVAIFYDGLNDEEKSTIQLKLESVPDNRYWRPNEPVVLIAGELATETSRHDNEGEVACAIFKLKDNLAADVPASQRARDVAAAANMQIQNKKRLTARQRGRTEWVDQPWNPVLLEWQVQLLRRKDKQGDVVGTDLYSPDFICENYEAPILSPELELLADAGAVQVNENIYVGSSILTGHASTLLRDEIISRLIGKLPPLPPLQAFFKEHKLSAANGNKKQRAALSDPVQVEALLDWFETTWFKAPRIAPKPLIDDPTFALVAALHEVLSTPMLSQQLGGFNDELITQKETSAFPIDDPVNFESYRAFSKAEVREAMQSAVPIAPMPRNGFNPIRAGALKILRLKLVDTFGQSREIGAGVVRAPANMSIDLSENLVELPPRVVQPTRLDFRWLASTGETTHASADTATTPICGWVVPNMLDRSLWFYEANGKAVGYFKTGLWRPSPDTDTAVEKIDDIANPHLRRVVRFVDESMKSSEGSAGIKDLDQMMVAVIEDALENIVTPNYRPPQGAAALVGRPVAIVRAQMDLQTLGPPVVSNTWKSFKRDMRSNDRSTADFTKVQFPVRLGEFGQLGDGLVGYWLEERDQDGEIVFGRARGTNEDDHKQTAVFYSPQSEYIDNAALETRFDALHDGAINFHQTIDDPPQMITMLLEPHGSVHITVGILPRQELRVAPELFAEVLDDIEIGFLHAPMLTPAGLKELPLRSSPDYDWSWVEEQKGDWVEFHPRKRVTRSVVLEAWDLVAPQLVVDDDAPPLGDGNALWQLLLDSGWLRQVSAEPQTIDVRDAVGAPEDRPPEFAIVPADEREAGELPDSFGGHEAVIGEMLNTVGIGVDPVVTQALFGRTNEIREGWMKLRRAETPLEMGM